MLNPSPAKRGTKWKYVHGWDRASALLLLLLLFLRQVGESPAAVVSQEEDQVPNVVSLPPPPSPSPSPPPTATGGEKWHPTTPLICEKSSIASSSSFLLFRGEKIRQFVTSVASLLSPLQFLLFSGAGRAKIYRGLMVPPSVRPVFPEISWKLMMTKTMNVMINPKRRTKKMNKGRFLLFLPSSFDRFKCVIAKKK